METRGFNAAQTVVIGFFVIIIIGAVILSLPVSSSTGDGTPFIDSFFTSVTSVCVTGLTTVTVAEQYSLFGKLVILFLIQLGGLGVVCCGIGVMTLFRRKINMRDRILIQNAYNLTSMDGLVRFIRRIIKSTFIIEGIGAVLFSFAFIPEAGFLRGVWYSVFHAVSAFCNAGIDVLGDSSFVIYRDNILVNLTTSFLVISGGIGFVVWWDIKENIVKARKIGKIRGQILKRLTVHSKLAIGVTFWLLIVGTALIFAFEYTNESTIGGLSVGKKLMSSFFESMTTRTAGFAAIPQENFRDSTYIILMVLMFIGGSPLGTAGGAKTTTVAMVFLAARSEIRGYRDTEVFHRKIAEENIRAGLSIIVLAISFLAAAIMALVIIEDMPLKEIAFECVSAMATVGLGRGNTASFSEVGKIVLCCLMFAGRIGPITLAMAFNRRKERMKNMRENAAAKIIVG